MKLAVMPVRTMMLAMVMTTTVVVMMMMAVGTLFVVAVVSSFSFCEWKSGVLVAVAVVAAVVEQQTPLMVLLVDQA